MAGFIFCLIGLILNSEGTFCRSWGREDTNTASQTTTRSNGFALTGYLASLMDYSYVVSYLYIGLKY